MMIYEYEDQFGNPKKYMTPGHINIDEFKNECKIRFGETPSIVNHMFKSDQKLIRKNSKGKVSSVLNSSKYSFKSTRGSTEVTIGYL